MLHSSPVSSHFLCLLHQTLFRRRRTLRRAIPAKIAPAEAGSGIELKVVYVNEPFQVRLLVT